MEPSYISVPIPNQRLLKNKKKCCRTKIVYVHYFIICTKLIRNSSTAKTISSLQYMVKNQNRRQIIWGTSTGTGTVILIMIFVLKISKNIPLSPSTVPYRTGNGTNNTKVPLCTYKTCTTFAVKNFPI